MAEASQRNQLLQVAYALQSSGRLAEAEAAYESLLARWPDLPDAWYNFGFVQRHLGRHEAALAAYQQALTKGAAQPEEIHLNRSVIFSDHLRDDAAAERELAAALALNPSYQPALLNLANLKEDQGRRQEALAVYERLLSLAPRHDEALARYATLKSVSSSNDPLIGNLKQAIARPGTSDAAKASLAFALGKTLDECGAYDEAFAAYETANRFSRASAPPGTVFYNRLQQERLVDHIIAAFPDVQAAPDTPSPKPAPIFICGMFRSGSTLVEQILAAHPKITAGGELNVLPAIVNAHLAPFPQPAPSPARASELAASYTHALAKLFPAAGIITDKRPDNFLYVGVIKRLFPHAKIIHTRRDPLDNCLSIFFLHLDHGMSYALDLADTAHHYREHDRLMAHWRRLYGPDILDFDYDALVRNPRPSVERLLAHCKLEWEEGCLAFHQVKNTVKTASVWQVRQPLYARSSGRWQNYARYVDKARALLGVSG